MFISIFCFGLIKALIFIHILLHLNIANIFRFFIGNILFKFIFSLLAAITISNEKNKIIVYNPNEDLYEIVTR